MAAAEPPWEWVDGDPVWAARFGLLTGILLGAASCLVSVLLLNWFGMLGLVSFPSLPWWAPQVLLWSILGPEFVVFWFLPRRYPTIGRIGISPIGLRLVLPVRTVLIRWTAVRQIGPDWVYFELLGGQRYRLTERQAARLTHFVSPHGS